MNLTIVQCMRSWTLDLCKVILFEPPSAVTSCKRNSFQKLQIFLSDLYVPARGSLSGMKVAGLCSQCLHSGDTLKEMATLASIFCIFRTVGQDQKSNKSQWKSLPACMQTWKPYSSKIALHRNFCQFRLLQKILQKLLHSSFLLVPSAALNVLPFLERSIVLKQPCSRKYTGMV